MAKKKPPEFFDSYCWACGDGLDQTNGVDLRGTMQIVQYHCCKTCFKDLTPFERILMRWLMDDDESGIQKAMKLLITIMERGLEGGRNFRDISEDELN